VNVSCQLMTAPSGHRVVTKPLPEEPTNLEVSSGAFPGRDSPEFRVVDRGVTSFDAIGDTGERWEENGASSPRRVVSSVNCAMGHIGVAR